MVNEEQQTICTFAASLNGSNMSRFQRLRHFIAILFIGSYLLLTGFFLVRHALGDSLAHPIGYFWTWDMFPNYPTESARRWAVGETAGGAYVQLLPNSAHRFRWGVHGDATRFDIDRRQLFFRQATLHAIKRHNATASDDPIRFVYLAEQYWPEKLNLPDELYHGFYYDEVTKKVYWASPANAGEVSKRFYWRVLDEADVETDGRVIAWEPSP
jgi:hypothetical protein